MDNELIAELKDTAFKIWDSPSLKTLGEQIRNIITEYQEVDAVIRCEKCGKLYGLKPHVKGVWCTCGVKNPSVNPQWVSREAAVSDKVAREFLVGRIQNDLHEVVKELEGVVNIIEHARKVINALKVLE